MALENELRVYKAKLPELTAEAGKYVLIYDHAVVDIFGTYEDAIKQGYAKFGLQPFLVKQIQVNEQLQFISRLIECPTSPDKSPKTAV